MNGRRGLTVIAAAVIAAILSGASGFAPHDEHPGSPTVLAQSCPYTGSGLNLRLLNGTWVESGGTVGLTVIGPYAGTVQVETGGSTAAGTRASVMSAAPGQTLQENKSSGPLTLYVRNCTSEHNHVQFRLTFPNQCDSITTHRYNWNMLNPAPPADPSVCGSGTPRPASSSGTPQTPGRSGPAEDDANEPHVIDPNSAGCDATGNLDTSLGVRTLSAQENGPRDIDIHWSTELSPIHSEFCIRISQAEPSSAPPEADGVEEGSFRAGFHDTWQTRGSFWSHEATVDGNAWAGLYPGGLFNISVQGIAPDGDYGPASTTQVRTSSVEQLGPVRNARALHLPGHVISSITVIWQPGVGHGNYLVPMQGETVTVEWRRTDQSFSHDRMTEVMLTTGWQATARQLFQNSPDRYFSAAPDPLWADTSYVFRLIPKAPNQDDGPPVEVQYHTPAATTPPAPTITSMGITSTTEEGVEREYLWARINASVSVDSAKFYVRSGETVRTAVVEDARTTDSLEIELPFTNPGQQNCVSIAGIAGLGPRGAEGPRSEEQCFTVIPE